MIAIGCDHAGFSLKTDIIAHLSLKHIHLMAMGCGGEPADYPEIALSVANEVASGNCEFGILICGTGIGMSIAANKVKGIRAAVCSDHYSTEFTRKHNDANILCMGARVIGPGLAQDLTDVFLNTEFEGGRHQRRVDLISEIENNTLTVKE